MVEPDPCAGRGCGGEKVTAGADLFRCGAASFSEHAFERFGKSLRRVAADLLADLVALGIEELDVRNAADACFFCCTAVAAVIDIEVGPDKFVMVGLYGGAGIHVLFHRLARWAPSGGEDEDDRLAFLFGGIDGAGRAAFECGAAFGEITGE